jgi:hypothetical protein
VNDVHAAAFQRLIGTATLPDIGPAQRPGAEEVAALNEKLARFFQENRIALDYQDHLRSAALLWHDHLEESHQLSQNLHDRSGSFLHGIMHRREPDYGNAKYWFRQVGQHPAFPEIVRQVKRLFAGQAGDTPPLHMLARDAWDPFAFVDACESAATPNSSGARRKLLQEVQAIEFKTLLQHL